MSDTERMAAKVKAWQGDPEGWPLRAGDRRDFSRIRCSDCGQRCGFGQHPGLLFFCGPCGARKGLS